MTRDRSDLDLGGILGAWMNDAAPASIPVLVLEEAFARTMAAPQVRVYPWQRLAGRGPRRSTARPRCSSRRPRSSSASSRSGSLGGGFGIAPGPSPTPSPTPSRAPSPSSSPSPPRPSFPATPIVPTASVAVVKPQSLATDGTVVWVLTETDPWPDRPGHEHGSGPASRPERRRTSTRASRSARTASGSPNGTMPRSTASTRPASSWSRRSRSVSRRRASSRRTRPCGSPIPTMARFIGSTRRRTRSSPRSRSDRRARPARTGLEAGSGASGSTSRTTRRSSGSTRSRTRSRRRSRSRTSRRHAAVSPSHRRRSGTTSCDGPQGMTRIDPVTNTVVTAVKLDEQGYNPSVIDGVPWVSIYTGDGNRRTSRPDLVGDERCRSRAGAGPHLRGRRRPRRRGRVRLGHRRRERPCPSPAAERFPARLRPADPG